MPYIERRYIPAVQVAKLMRAALKAAFPKVRFSVRSKLSIDVSYVDGPPVEAVERVAKRYAGSYFDGMIDYQGAIYHELDGEPVRLGASFVFVKRELSDAALAAGLEKAKAAGAWNADKVELVPYSFKRDKDAGIYPKIDGNEWHMGAPDRGSPMHLEAAIAAWFDQDRPAAELEPVSLVEADRLKVVGDDGYSEQCAQAVSEHHARHA